MYSRFTPLTMIEGSTEVTQVSLDEEKKGVIHAIFRAIQTTKSVAEKIIALATAFYGLSLVGYGRNFPTQIRVVSIANVGGFNKIRRTLLALTKGVIGAASTATIRSPSLAFATIAIAKSRERKNLAIEYDREHAAAMADGKMSKEEYKKLKKIRRKQVKEEARAIRRIKSARNFFTRTLHNSNLGQLKNILGDTVLMFTAIIASRERSILGNLIYRYYIILNMGNLFLEANRKIGYPFTRRVTKSLYIFDPDREELVFNKPDEKTSFLSPITHFFLSRVPFNTYERESEDVAAEEAAFLRNVGALFTYSVATGLVLYTPGLARKINAALIASSLSVHGLSGLLRTNGNSDDDVIGDPSTQPGLLRGGYGGQLTLGLTAVSLVTGFLLEQNKLYVPKFWTPMTTLDNYVENAFEFGVKIL